MIKKTQLSRRELGSFWIRKYFNFSLSTSSSFSFNVNNYKSAIADSFVILSNSDQYWIAADWNGSRLWIKGGNHKKKWTYIKFVLLINRKCFLSCGVESSEILKIYY